MYVGAYLDRTGPGPAGPADLPAGVPVEPACGRAVPARPGDRPAHRTIWKASSGPALGILRQAWPNDQADIWKTRPVRRQRHAREAPRRQENRRRGKAVRGRLGRGRPPRLRGQGLLDRRRRRRPDGRGAVRHGLLAAQPAHHRRRRDARRRLLPPRSPPVRTATAKSTSARKASTAPTGCWCGASGAT